MTVMLSGLRRERREETEPQEAMEPGGLGWGGGEKVQLGPEYLSSSLAPEGGAGTSGGASGAGDRGPPAPTGRTQRRGGGPGTQKHWVRGLRLLTGCSRVKKKKTKSKTKTSP